MSSLGHEKPGVMIGKMEDSWGSYVGFGVLMLIAGGIAGANLFASTLASILYFVAFMIFAGVTQLIHAFRTQGWSRRLIYALSAVLYLAASGVAFFDPILSAVGISLMIGGLLIASGVFRIISGARDHAHAGWGWIVASGVLTLAVGVALLAAWPGMGFWLLGALLTADLIFQGWAYIALGLALRERRNRLGPASHQD
jgi:uncharacterized membrane protein HdeD (DUF308 family)